MSSKIEAKMAVERKRFIESLLKSDLTIDEEGIPSVADKGSKISVGIAKAWVEQLGTTQESIKSSGQTAGKSFENAVTDYLKSTFSLFGHIRPGSWSVLSGSNRASVRISNFEQYQHLLRLSEKAEQDPDLKAILGGDYLIEPDVVVVRDAEEDIFLDPKGEILTSDYSTMTPLRRANFSVDSSYSPRQHFMQMDAT